MVFRFNYEIVFTSSGSGIDMLHDSAEVSIQSIVGSSSKAVAGFNPVLSSLSGFRGDSSLPSTGALGRQGGCDTPELDFVIAGFEKCGTTFLMRHVLGKTDQVYMGSPDSKHSREIHLLENDEVEEFMELYRGRSNMTNGDGDKIFNAYKSPGTLKSKSSFDNLQKFFPTAKFVVTLRHPVLWFQSLYNFKLRTKGQLKSPEECMGNCGEGCWKGLKRQNSTNCAKSKPCTGGSNFHHFLSRLGWTKMKDPKELDLLDHHKMSVHRFPRAQLFLTEIGQMEGTDLKVTNNLMYDLEEFIGLEERALPRFHKRAREQTNYTARAKTDSEGSVLHICDEKHSLLREHLLGISRKASEWITTYFIRSKHVHVSSKSDFLERLEQWKHDPCEKTQ